MVLWRALFAEVLIRNLILTQYADAYVVLPDVALFAFDKIHSLNVVLVVTTDAAYNLA